MNVDAARRAAQRAEDSFTQIVEAAMVGAAFREAEYREEYHDAFRYVIRATLGPMSRERPDIYASYEKARRELHAELPDHPIEAACEYVRRAKTVRVKAGAGRRR